MRKISFVIPCYGSEHTIEHVVSGIEQIVRKEDDYEVILVNDCSPDNVWSVIQKLCESAFLRISDSMRHCLPDISNVKGI